MATDRDWAQLEFVRWQLRSLLEARRLHPLSDQDQRLLNELLAEENRLLPRR